MVDESITPPSTMPIEVRRIKTSSTCNHDDGGARCDDVVDKHVHQVHDVHQGETFVIAQELEEVLDDKDGVGNVGQDPAAPLFEKLLEGVRAVCCIIGKGRVPQTPAVDHHQSRHPSVLAYSNRNKRIK